MAYPLKEVMSSWTEETRDRSVMNGRRDMIHYKGVKMNIVEANIITYVFTYMAGLHSPNVASSQCTQVYST